MVFSAKLKISVALAIAMLFAVFSLVSYIGLPFLVEHIAIKQLILSPDSASFRSWKNIPFPIYTRVYVFNVTNSEDVLSTNTRPILKELGPFTFLETREKVNISWHPSNGTVSYRQIRRWNFVAELSKGSLDDIVVHLNVPVVASGYDIKQKGGDFISYETINSISNEINDSLFLNHTVRELLFEGYHDEYIFVGRQFGLNTQFDKFGWFYGKNNTSTDGLYRIFSGQADTINKFGFLDAWNYKRKLNFWNNTNCDRIDTSTAGDFRPPFRIPKPKSFKLFIAEFCRSFPLTFMKEIEENGLKLDRYWISNKAFDYTLQENICYCYQQNCPANGVFNVSVCSFGSPIFVSFPHFLYADPTYTTSVKGMEADPEEHSFYIDVEPSLGFPTKVKARFQINVLLERNEGLELTRNYQRENVFFPMFWTETTMQVGEELLDKLRLNQSVPLIILISSIVQLIIASVIIFFTCVYVLRKEKFAKTPLRNHFELIACEDTDSDANTRRAFL